MPMSVVCFPACARAASRPDAPTVAHARGSRSGANARVLRHMHRGGRMAGRGTRTVCPRSRACTIARSRHEQLGRHSTPTWKMEHLSAVDVRMRAELANSDGVLDSPIEFSLGYSTPPLTLTLWLSERCEFARRRTGTFTCTRLHSLRHHARDAADEHKYGQRVRVNCTRART